MTARDCACRSENGLPSRRDLTVSEIDELTGHLYFCRDNADHFRVIDGFGQIHQTAALGIELLSGFDEPEDGTTHRGIRRKLASIKFRVAAANVQDVRIRRLMVAQRRKLDNASSGLL